MRSTIYHVFLGYLVCLVLGQEDDLSFPDDFQFGVATAAYQVEGAWDEDGKGENIWDYLTHNRADLIADQSNGDIACDTYHKTEEDVAILKELGVDFYRFSISWSRILPTGHDNYVNEEGVKYYRDLITLLKEQGIKPFVTMYHWDLPQPLQEIGGWPNPLLADLFVDYARVLFKEFGDIVDDWITFNEPIQVCEQGYSVPDKAPAYTQQGIGGYLCAHTLLIAHGKTYHMYEEEGFRRSGARVGISIDTGFSEPETEEDRDKEAAERSMQMNYGWYAHPIFSDEGDYPEIMRDRIRELSLEEGFSESRLPSFTEDEITMIQGSADFLGLNHYTSGICKEPDWDNWHPDSPSHSRDVGVDCYQRPEWGESGSVWLRVYPEGLRKLLNWIKEEYNNPELIITENGFSDRDGDLNDCGRISYYNSYLEQVLLAIQDGCNVTGYTAWSFMDNFEWRMGYTERFGLYYVDFEDEDRPRVPKMSSYIYKQIIETRKIDWEYTPLDFDKCDWDDDDDNEIKSS